MNIERQELHCHNCNCYVQFDLDLSIDDNYVLYCPKCGHDHYRVVKNGKITDKRWGQSQSQTRIGLTTWTTTSTYVTSTSSSSFLYSSWMNTTTAC
jgi:hypothetical protein